MLDERGHDTSSSLDTKGQGVTLRISCVFSDVSQERMAAWTAAPYATASLGLMLLLGSFATEEVRHELDDTGDTSGSTNENNFVDASLVDFRVVEDGAEAAGPPAVNVEERRRVVTGDDTGVG